MNKDSTFIYAVLAFPFFALFLRACVALPIEWLVRKFAPPRVARLLTRQFCAGKSALNSSGRGEQLK